MAEVGRCLEAILGISEWYPCFSIKDGILWSVGSLIKKKPADQTPQCSQPKDKNYYWKKVRKHGSAWTTGSRETLTCIIITRQLISNATSTILKPNWSIDKETRKLKNVLIMGLKPLEMGRNLIAHISLFETTPRSGDGISGDVSCTVSGIETCPPPPPPPASDNRNTWIAVGSAFGFILISLFIGFVVYFSCSRSRRKKSAAEKYRNESYVEIRGIPHLRNTLYYNGVSSSATDFPRNALKFVESLGEGANSNVYAASIEGFRDHVAVKMAKEGMELGKDKIVSFEQEAMLLNKVRGHNHIVKLMGSALSTRPFLLVFEMLPHGDLKNFLRTFSPDNFGILDGAKIRLEYDRIKLQDRNNIARQIARAGSFIEELGIVHRDIAARNCLVGHKFHVKLADFGMAVEVKAPDGVYRGSPSEETPTRWIPPEVFRNSMFSSKSDVWAFGVLMWEIYSHGFSPYFGLSPVQIREFLEQGGRLERPDLANERTFEIMSHCWNEEASERPSFLHLCKLLSDL